MHTKNRSILPIENMNSFSLLLRNWHPLPSFSTCPVAWPSGLATSTEEEGQPTALSHGWTLATTGVARGVKDDHRHKAYKERP